MFQLVSQRVQNQCKDYGYVPKENSVSVRTASRKRRVQKRGGGGRRKRLTTTDGYADDDSESEMDLADLTDGNNEGIESIS